MSVRLLERLKYELVSRQRQGNTLGPLLHLQEMHKTFSKSTKIVQSHTIYSSLVWKHVQYLTYLCSPGKS